MLKLQMKSTGVKMRYLFVPHLMQSLKQLASCATQ